MRINWKRFTLGAFVLASLSLMIFGCGDYGGSPAAQVSVDSTPPTAPTGLVLASTPTDSSVSLSWTASTDNVAVTGYVIYCNGVEIATVAQPGFTDNSVIAATAYEYEVKARDAAGNKSPGTKITATTATTVPATYTLSGKVSFNGSGLDGVIVTVSGPGAGIISTTNGGNYAFAGAQNGVYTLTPAVAGFTFTPASQTVTIDNGNVSVPEFTATAIPSSSYTISGRVSFNGAGLAGVTVTVAGAGAGSLVTDGSGFYSFTGVVNNSYSITPSRSGYVFLPTSRSITINNANKPGQDFSANLPGTTTGGVTYPDGSATGVITYPTGTVIGGVTYPPGTIIGGVTYPTGTVIGGITYPTATVIGGVTYPTGTVIGGVTYPNGVVIGGVTYPPGTVVGGIAFPVGTVITGVVYPTGTVIGGVIYPSGTVTGGVIYPSGTVIGTITYPSAVVIGGVAYPSGSVTGAVTFPSATVIAGVSYPTGIITGGTAYPTGLVSGGLVFQDGAITATLLFP